MTSSTVTEGRFIPAFAFSSAIYAAITPYIALMVRNLGYSTVLVGVLLGIFEGAGIAGPFVFGHLADKTGRYRPLLVLTCVLPALAAFPAAILIHPLASAPLLAAMAFGFKSNQSVLDAATTIQIGPEGNYGKIRVWGSIAFVLVTLFLQWTPWFRPVNAVNTAFWITLIAAAAIVSMLSVPLATRGGTGAAKVAHGEAGATAGAAGGEAGAAGAERGARGEDSALVQPGGAAGIAAGTPLKTKIVSVYCLVGFMLIFFSRFSMTAFYTYFPLYLSESVQWNAVGLMFALATATEIPCILFSGRIIRRFGSFPLLALAAAAVCVRLLLWAAFPFKPVIIAAQLLHSLCFGVYFPSAIDFISRVFPPEKRGFGMSIFLALGSGLPMLIGNMSGGLIVEAAGYRSLFAAYAAVSGAAVLLYAVLRRKTSVVC
jgi:PPP family 3-phenylpropionic acid transporter